MANGSNQKRALIAKLDQLPPKRMAEVEDFVDFLASKTRRRAAQAILEGVARAAKAGSKPMSMDEIQAEVNAVRRARRTSKRA
ncbi:MAG: DUF2281 domain-containing protein [Pseudomonadota bacterium]